MSRRILLGILSLLSLMLVTGCFIQYRSGRQTEECTKQLFAMDTFMSFTAYGKNSEAAVEAAMKEVQRLDGLLSTGSPSSEVSFVNEHGGGTLSEDSAAILKTAREIYEETEGLFDYTIYPLMELWGFPTREYHVPAEQELAEALSLVDASKVSLDGNTVQLGKNQRLDFGGIAKGYTSDRVMEIFQEYGITSGMVSLGGNVQVLGAKPDGSPWRIGIRDPEEREEEPLAAVEVENRAVITSGGYERYFEEDGNTYIHILDPKTGYPADKDLISVTIISEDGMLADALSTSVYLMGLEDGISYWKAHKEEFDMVLVTDSGELYMTENIRGQVECFSDIAVNYISETE